MKERERVKRERNKSRKKERERKKQTYRQKTIIIKIRFTKQKRRILYNNDTHRLATFTFL